MYVDFFTVGNYVFLVEKHDSNIVFIAKKAPYECYIESKNGQYKSLTGEKLEYKQFASRKELNDFVEKHKKDFLICESDIKPDMKVLERHYEREPSLPELDIMYFDIEVDPTPEGDFATVDNPYGKINTVSFADNKSDRVVTLVVKDENIDEKELFKLKEKHGEENFRVYDTEEELLLAFGKMMDRYDVVTGWNIWGYDLPYIFNRIRILRKENPASFLRHSIFYRLPDNVRDVIIDDDMDLDDVKRIAKILENLKTEEQVFDNDSFSREKYGMKIFNVKLYGRVSIDYLFLYRKNLAKELPSYSLDYVGEYEIGERKVEYEGSLHDLRKNNFEQFIDYSRQDVLLVKKIDIKNRYIELSNIISHRMMVNMEKTVDSLRLIENALILLAHEKGYKVPDKTYINRKSEIKKEKFDTFMKRLISKADREEIELIVPFIKKYIGNIGNEAGGAFVVDGKTGLHKNLASVDINSLYPNTIRTFNLSPETIVGQIIPVYTLMYYEKIKKESKRVVRYNDVLKNLFGFLEYHMVISKADIDLYVEFKNGIEIINARDLYDMIFGENSQLAITAFGTLVRTDNEGIVPQLLSKWYDERKKYKKLSKIFADLAKGIKLT